MDLSTNNFFKIQGIKELKKYKLPFSKTIFIFDCQKQEKEIDEFLKGRKYVSIRSDSKNHSDFCPHDLKCPRNKAKEFIRELNSQSYAAIVSEYVPWEGDKASGNILILRKYILVELMGEGPLIWLNRDGKVDERIKLRKKDLKEVEHLGTRLLEKSDLIKIIKMVKNLPVYKIIEFTVRPEGLYFWQIRDDETAKTMENGG